MERCPRCRRPSMLDDASRLCPACHCVLLGLGLLGIALAIQALDEPLVEADLIPYRDHRFDLELNAWRSDS